MPKKPVTLLAVIVYIVIIYPRGCILYINSERLKSTPLQYFTERTAVQSLSTMSSSAVESSPCTQVIHYIKILYFIWRSYFSPLSTLYIFHNTHCSRSYITGIRIYVYRSIAIVRLGVWFLKAYPRGISSTRSLERSAETRSVNDLRMINDPYNIILNYKCSDDYNLLFWSIWKRRSRKITHNKHVFIDAHKYRPLMRVPTWN